MKSRSILIEVYHKNAAQKSTSPNRGLSESEQFPHRFGESFRRGRPEKPAFSGGIRGILRYLQFPGMKKKSPRPGAARKSAPAVFTVAGKGVSVIRRLDADLVGPARFDPYLRQGVENAAFAGSGYGRNPG
jgi:hypothetical protein